MQRIFSVLRRRQPTVLLSRLAWSDAKADKNYYWKIPLQPKIEAINKKYESTLLYSTHIEGHKEKFTFADRRNLQRKEELREEERIRTRPLPLALRYLGERPAFEAVESLDHESEEQSNDELDPNALSDSEDEHVARSIEQRNMLAGKITNISDTKANIFESMRKTRENIKNAPNPYLYEKYPAAWMLDYDNYDEKEDYADKSQYGTPDPTIPVSKVPCYGCGGPLQCIEPSLPGYLPSELIRNQPDSVLRNLTCQRCHFLINYNTALNLKVEPSEYINMLAEIKDKKGLAILMVDLLDFPCSIWPEMINIVGKDRPIMLVGNKVDLLPKDSSIYLKHVKSRLEDAVIDAGIPIQNIRHTCLISAHTNYGVEDLITKLHAIWRYRGDVYLMGCTNVGKSTLFNALLRSDYCRVEASSIIKRATASIWPGTTLKMLKFPILRPTDKKLYERSMRLKNERRLKLHEEQMQLGQTQNKKVENEPTMLIGHIGQTFLKDPEEQAKSLDPFSLVKGDDPNKKRYINDKDMQYIESRWCYDTPGVIQPDQIIHLLTTDELLRVIPKKIILPRVYYIHKGMTLFLAGLGRIDYVDGPERIRLAVFSSAKLPILIVHTKEAEDIYSNCKGTEILGVPMGDEERMNKFPALERPDEPIVVESGEHGDWKSCCDIVLSSAGWVSVNLPRVSKAEFHAWTPECRGIHVREPPLLPYASAAYRGKRIAETPAYQQKIPKFSRI